jgi:hypothetical protein
MTNIGEFLRRHPHCCFCGGQTAAATIDHQPARIIFPDKRRPKGLEFPACAICNRQTSADEALLAFVCRFAGSRRTNAARDFHRLKNIVGSINQSFPGLLQRMHGQRLWAKERGVWVRIGAIDVNQPEVNEGLCRIAAKLALAIYYERRLHPASNDCWINTQWTHCQNVDTVKRVQNIINAIPNQAVLQMGKWNTQDSFFLKYHFEDGDLFSAAIFHQSVALIAQLRESQMATPWKMAIRHGANTRPGNYGASVIARWPVCTVRDLAHEVIALL